MTEENNTTPEIRKTRFKRIITLKKMYLGILLGFVLGVFITFISALNIVITPMQKESAKVALMEKLAADDDNLISRHFITESFKVYENSRLGYQLEYPKGIVSVYDCPDVPCASIREFTLRVEPLRYSSLEDLQKRDLYCEASGVGGSIHCENSQVIDFTNSLGTKGYRVERTKIIEQSGFETEEYADVAYVFPIEGDAYYKSILLAVDSPTEENLNALAKIANSFRLVDSK